MVTAARTLRVQIINKPDTGVTGTSRYVMDLRTGLQTAGIDVQTTMTASVKSVQMIKRLGIDLDAFFKSYPVQLNLEVADLYHLPTQTMAILLLTQRFWAPVVVTVLDIIPWLTRHDPALNTLKHPIDALFYRFALQGLRRANALIAISNYTKQTLVNALNMDPRRIHVIYPSVDHMRFHPIPVSQAFRARYQLDPTYQYILYVGSEDPRKNLPTLIQALALLGRHNVRLLKIGRAHFSHEPLLNLLQSLQLQDRVLFYDDVPEEDLPLFYNAADMLILPSFYEGFGYPVVEAMACGTPVIISNITSLLEVVGSAGLSFSPHDSLALAKQMERLLNDADLRAALQIKGLARAQEFQLSKQINQILGVYAAVQQ